MLINVIRKLILFSALSIIILRLSAQTFVPYDSLYFIDSSDFQAQKSFTSVLKDSSGSSSFSIDTTKSNSFISGGFKECKLAQNDYLSYVEGSQLIINSLFQKNKQADFSLFDTQGREIINDVVYFGINTFDVGNLPAAFYLVKVKNQGGVYTQKIFISPSR